MTNPVRSVGKFKLNWLTDFPVIEEAALLNLIKTEKPEKMPALEGRVAVRRFDSATLGPLVIKEYRRGGVIGKLLGNIHFRLGKGRARREAEFLTISLKHGISVPGCIGFIEEGETFYRTWLVLREIPNALSLAELARRDAAQSDAIVDAAANEIIKLIRARIFHIDLHPGNVLYGSDSRVYIIDFDKAAPFRGTLKQLRDLYLCRWRRAVIKHNLSPSLAERMSLQLRQITVWDELGGR
jgi:3-deoxy-D-manno-octulosonic acid kinase